ncbi:Uncharacterized protein FKW44_014004 [Caligus rogercresseyi]|uniref:Uncharacterized protein n=1 Tax=Caligus rogercresseyi TaxID=217165 RepID=A0A7T8JYN6_CALRO|nr:Uncharacterized protein FKW44_014004 [Caligus rogercresseyi]
MTSLEATNNTLAVKLAMKRVGEDELFDHLRKLRDHCHDVISVGGIMFTN